MSKEQKALDDLCNGSITEQDNARNILQQAINDLNACRNELCLYCGKYKHEHEGWCNECRWKH